MFVAKKKWISSILMVGIALFSASFVFAETRFIEIDRVIVEGDQVTFIAQFDTGEATPSIATLWFEYGKDQQQLSSRTLESIHPMSSGWVRHQVYEILEPGDYFVRPVMEVEDAGERVYGSLRQFHIDERVEDAYDPYSEYEPYGGITERDTSKIVFEDDGTIAEKDNVFTFANFWDGVKSFFGFSSSRSTSEETQEREEDEGTKTENQEEALSSSEGDTYYNPRSAAYNDERGEVLYYDTQYEKYYRPPQNTQVQTTTGTGKSLGEISYLPLIFLLLVLALVTTFIYLEKRKKARTQSRVTPPYSRRPVPQTTHQPSRTRIVRRGEAKYAIPHRDIETVRKEVDGAKPRT